MEYLVVCANEEDILAAKVNALIKDGWLPQGGVSVALHNSFLTLQYQAMVKN